MVATHHARTELAAFLKARRRQLTPEDVGLQPTGAARRTPGLRREEVSLLSGVSATWYTWLEQARSVNPSRQVINALARTLRLSDAERRYALRLAGHSDEPPAGPDDVAIPAHTQRLLDALGASPAYALTRDWSIVAWNHAYQRFYPHVATASAAERNLLWLIFTDPAVRELLGDWDADSRRFLAEFRAEVISRVDEASVTRLIERLRRASSEFRAGWDSHGVDQFSSSERRFEHPQVGALLLEHHKLELADCPGVHLVVYTAADTASASKLAQLCA
jgi:transcriptional regulator with XRE-family HTH domain